ncbi:MULTISPECIES: hypothetical protein [Acidianus]|uniref:Uncharacterized protein n=1 Tax=Candidatus Acidianus copahuensis TaxID=1160895 RepID=A0A031LVE8_9CREN|nr:MULTISPECIES: hypothetical protein [Acidianus]EZQ11073.1 hypothetical protein CM19_02430 [Candidatus Acidianus copahuensis]NON63440.1 hypothetical protein [Acidianus sp. RZ1]
MLKEILGDYEPKGKMVQQVGRFIFAGLDDPLHITTVSGLAIYGIGKMIERRSNYGIRRAKVDLELIRRDFSQNIREIMSLKL